MAEKYIGWKLFDKITIVTKPMTRFNYETCETILLEDVQGYIVDPSNKKQLASAREWGTTYNYIYEEVDGKKVYKERVDIPPEEFTYDNKDFTLELAEAAEHSSQGGKLSFWNCWVTASDGKRFLIGIAANLLLDVLKSTTVINGVVQDKLMFARCKGGVGMLSQNMSSYKDALDDEATRKKSSKGKTSKHQVGHVYSTLTQNNVYLGNFYQWYEPIYETVRGHYNSTTSCVGFKRLEKPKEWKWFPIYRDNFNYAANFGTWQLEEKLPARREGDFEPVINVNLDDCIETLSERHRKQLDTWLVCKAKGHSMFKHVAEGDVGISTSSTEYTMPLHERELLIEFGYKVID